MLKSVSSLTVVLHIHFKFNIYSHLLSQLTRRWTRYQLRYSLSGQYINGPGSWKLEMVEVFPRPKFTFSPILGAPRILLYYILQLAGRAGSLVVWTSGFITRAAWLCVCDWFQLRFFGLASQRDVRWLRYNFWPPWSCVCWPLHLETFPSHWVCLCLCVCDICTTATARWSRPYNILSVDAQILKVWL